MSYNLFLDDVRNPIDLYKLSQQKNEVYNEDWVVVRSFNEFKECIMNRGIPKKISFDHDLADEHYVQGAKSNFQQFDYNEVIEKTGLDCLKWLIEYTNDNKIDLSLVNEFLVHSFNVVGRKNILNLLKDIFITNDYKNNV